MMAQALKERRKMGDKMRGKMRDNTTRIATWHVDLGLCGFGEERAHSFEPRPVWECVVSPAQDPSFC